MLLSEDQVKTKLKVGNKRLKSGGEVSRTIIEGTLLFYPKGLRSDNPLEICVVL
jgi:hypothetical protein